MSKHPVIVVCPRCGHEFIMGKTGTVYGCDACTGAVRNSQGEVFMPCEVEKEYEPKKDGEA